MAAGSLLSLALSRLPAGMTAAVATSHVVLVVALSALFLHENLDWAKNMSFQFHPGGGQAGRR